MGNTVSFSLAAGQGELENDEGGGELPGVLELD